MQTWLHWRHQDAQLVQKHFLALFHPKPNECLHFDLESCNLMCTYAVVTHPCHIPPLAQAHPMMLCIYTSMFPLRVLDSLGDGMVLYSTEVHALSDFQHLLSGLEETIGAHMCSLQWYHH